MDDSLRFTFLDDASFMKDTDSVAERGNKAHVVGNEEHRNAQRFLQLFQQLEDARLNGYVKVARGFVRNKKLCAAAKGKRDDDALPLAAGKLVRIFFQRTLRIHQLHQVQHLIRIRKRFLAGKPPVRADHIVQHLANGKHGVQAGHGVLEDHRYLFAAHTCLHPALAVGKDVLPIQQD